MSPFVIVAVVLFIGALIFVHEMGHFLVAKYFDIKVEKFSLGFGPPLVAFTRGETTYQVALIPLGGYVRMAGEYGSEELPREERARSFTHAPVHQRALVALAGPAANLVFPVVCFFAYNVLGPEVLPPVVGQVEPGRPADRAGLRPGDRIARVDGERTWSFDRVVQLISARPGETLPVEVERAGERLLLEVTPEPMPGTDFLGRPEEKGMISVSAHRDAPVVGIEDPARLPPGLEGLRTGDTVLRVGGDPVRVGDRLGPRFAAHAGRTVEVLVGRPRLMKAGDVLEAERTELLRFETRLPRTVSEPSDLGLALGAAFVRATVSGGAADEAGIRPGDRVLAADGEPVRHFWRFLGHLAAAEDRPVQVDLRRDGAERTVVLRPQAVECEHPVSRQRVTRFDHGFGEGAPLEPGAPCERLARPRASWSAMVPPKTEQVRLSLDEALSESVRLTQTITRQIATALYGLVVTQEVSTDKVGGPLQFMSVAAQAAERGLLAYLSMLAVISINLGVFNLLPIPVLDGGHLVFCLVEAVKRKPLSAAARERAALVGLALLGMLLILALSNDIRSLGVF